MADAAVEYLLKNIEGLQLHHTHLISDVKTQLKKLENELLLFRSFLRYSRKRQHKDDDSLIELVRQIREVVYEAEDIIDALVTQAAVSKTKKYFDRAFKTPEKFLSVAKEVEAVASRIRDIYGDRIDLVNLNVADEGPEEIQVSPVREENVVGIEDQAFQIFGYLKEETEDLDVISIVGMPGLGKTTLARKLFRDPEIQYEFPTRIWIYVSQEFTRENVFLTILSEFTILTDDMYHKTDQELAQLVRVHLQTGKFLIVMDDVWTHEDWESLRIALPGNNKMGKVLITSRNQDVARHANPYRDPHWLRLLTHDEAWLLFRYQVFGGPDYPPELEVLGRDIVNYCGGLPLAIVVIGGILAQKNSATQDMGAKESAWGKVAERMSTSLSEDPMRRTEKIISMSFEKLPYHLKPCLLYLGMFPEDFEIPVWKLTRMWIAEGFIQWNGVNTLEETAENYLDDLIHWNLINIDKRGRDGKVKTCRIHDMLREFCKYHAGQERESLLREIIKSSEGTFYPPLAEVQKQRRICVHSDVLRFISSEPYGPRLRSFVCFSKEEIDLPEESLSDIFGAFKLLRVFEAQPIKFTKIPGDMYHLIHLRYMVISFDLAFLPEAFSKLWNIQTLVVDTPSRTLDVRANIWKMIHLRHFKTNASMILPETSESIKECEQLQTLGKISTESCTQEVFDRIRNVKKLGVRGRLAMLLDANNASFDNFRKLHNLQELNLLNDAFLGSLSEIRLPGLPLPHQFPPKLTNLTLSNTFLDWQHMSILGQLENLKVLKLKDKAFTGKCWESTIGGFRHLEILHIGNMDLVIWIASWSHFPRLRILELRNCDELQEVPIGLADIPTFEVLDLYYTKFASASAKKIQEANRKIRAQQSFETNGFRLIIFPHEE